MISLTHTKPKYDILKITRMLLSIFFCFTEIYNGRAVQEQAKAVIA